jgi:DNA-binding transcriptional LysR family regulator
MQEDDCYCTSALVSDKIISINTSHHSNRYQNPPLQAPTGGIALESGDLRVFQAVANEGSITKAAAKLNYVQSNVTSRIQQLETDLQTVLFHRHNRGMTLTSSGKSLLEYANKILGLLEEASKASLLRRNRAARWPSVRRRRAPRYGCRNCWRTIIARIRKWRLR